MRPIYLFVIIITVLSFSSCQQNESYNDKIIGTWEYTRVEDVNGSSRKSAIANYIEDKITFYADGSLKYKDRYSNNLVGEWQIVSRTVCVESDDNWASDINWNFGNEEEEEEEEDDDDDYITEYYLQLNTWDGAQQYSYQELKLNSIYKSILSLRFTQPNSTTYREFELSKSYSSESK